MATENGRSKAMGTTDEERAHRIVESAGTFTDPDAMALARERTWEKIGRGLSARKRSPRAISLLRYGVSAACIVITAVSVFFFTHTGQQVPLTVIANDCQSVRHVMLPDGSGVWLYYGAVLQYPEKFADTSREVSLRGEAFFDVVRDEDAPFRVTSAGVEVTVLGTRFNIGSSGGGPSVEVVLESGAVEVSVQGSTGLEPTILSPGQRALVDPQEETMRIDEVDLQLYTSWKDDYLYINTQSLENVCRMLGKKYRVDITVAGGRLPGEVFTGRFYKNQSLEEILDIISMVLSAGWERDGDTYILKH